ncbi:MAG: heat-inducible transcriptional repressor HrcA [Clostridia bacterium]|nr:heat-inducible transcriptional repressor HrcA [Clostridia bacterium]
MLDRRKLKILQAIIDDYIMTASPVGSRTISKRPDVGLSSATIRNEMSDLEELGYLEQPHTSAGRIPSDKAFRLYVNKMMTGANLSSDEIRFINEHIYRRASGIESVIGQTAELLSEMTSYTSMVLTPELRGVRLRRVQIVGLNDTTAILVVVTDAGLTKNAYIRLPYPLKPEVLEAISSRLTQVLYNKRIMNVTAAQITDVLLDYGDNLDFVSSIMGALERNLSSSADNVQLYGTKNLLLHPEYSSVEKARQLLEVFEEKQALYNVLSHATDVEFSITIGHENETPTMKDCSIVTMTYRAGDMPIGSMGVIGPTRMEYAKVLALMRHVGQSLSDALTNMLKED